MSRHKVQIANVNTANIKVLSNEEMIEEGYELANKEIGYRIENLK